MASTAPKYAWMNGKVIPWEQCVLHGRTAGAFLGSNVFEGVRAYWSPQLGELFLFKHESTSSASAARSRRCGWMSRSRSARSGRDALDLLRANEFSEDVHFVPVAFFGMGAQTSTLSARP